MQSEITYQFQDFLEENMKFTAYRESIISGESLIHKHNFLELIYILSGNATHYIDNIEYQVSKGDLLLIDTNQTHFHKSENGVLYADMVLLPDFISENLHANHNAIDVFAYYLYNSETSHPNGIPKTPLIRFRGSDLIAADAIVNAMCDEILNKESNYIDIVSSYLNILFYMMIRNIEKSNQDKVMHDIQDIIPGIIDFIERNYGNQITLNEIAKKFFYSPSYFSRAFKKNFGMTFSSYLQNIRVQKVIQLMQDQSLSIEDISEKIGYRDKRELYRAFKNVTGTTPSNYRKTKMN
ncbi:MAG: AraC family transcriptional regulator [Oscillospiraceae bacterium]|nr:AraC family transcriptional regulator [Oscillospiraceae bacterium]